ncbi:MAG: phospho-N-acetylmuramoyl-pentapeptide-transferase [Kiritimatiellia bacterium]|jgi:phospho-N-acetylmuramoyl-pentapeptide-transferase|nr:phospho-N-acetylmuramoyl-pentapeptide-transferase [Kiritimatiellia bacterium]MDP6809331.1 phospho-N-acetylmuramoyl-pentapeptide-transferase [Kiritimatiellia bacterium]MDP7023991.1 phospho-N-acetylmuramoyl-pentapeptide-transferase [Kiritimatiellia bacterium]
MLYYLHLLEQWFSPLRVFRYITIRALAGAGTAFVLTLVLAPWLIRQLKRLHVSQPERKEEAPPLFELHGHKQDTPTMGGLLIILAIVVAALIWIPLTSLLAWMTVATLCYMGMVGFWDDYKKVVERNTKGLSPRKKLLLQGVWAVAMASVLMLHPETAERTRHLFVPFLKAPLIDDIGWLGACLFVGVVVVGATNAVNLTDGLDGLAIGCSSSVALSYLVMAYMAGHLTFAEYLMVPFVSGAGELAVFCGILMGACLGFLWFNCHPAHVFMGDTGSLALGGSIAMVAVLIKQEIVLVIVGGVFVMEALSVIIQVVSFKTRGKRVFAMAPIHHHFEMKQWSETQVVVRFWILSIICALAGILTLKVR